MANYTPRSYFERDPFEDLLRQDDSSSIPEDVACSKVLLGGSFSSFQPDESSSSSCWRGGSSPLQSPRRSPMSHASVLSGDATYIFMDDDDESSSRVVLTEWESLALNEQLKQQYYSTNAQQSSLQHLQQANALLDALQQDDERKPAAAILEPSTTTQHSRASHTSSSFHKNKPSFWKRWRKRSDVPTTIATTTTSSEESLGDAANDVSSLYSALDDRWSADDLVDVLQLGWQGHVALRKLRQSTRPQHVIGKNMEVLPNYEHVVARQMEAFQRRLFAVGRVESTTR